jgi:hypothetical protein
LVLAQVIAKKGYVANQKLPRKLVKKKIYKAFMHLTPNVNCCFDGQFYAD